MPTRTSTSRSTARLPTPSGKAAITSAATACCRPTPPDAATTVRVRNGRVSVTDGPWIETKDQLGGYYLIEARDLNEAIQVASRIPGAKFGCVEVRPVAEDVQTLQALGFVARDSAG